MGGLPRGYIEHACPAERIEMRQASFRGHKGQVYGPGERRSHWRRTVRRTRGDRLVRPLVASGRPGCIPFPAPR